MVAKKYQNPNGGLNEAGRKYFENKEGGDLKAPQSSGTDGRRVSFAARFSGMSGPLKDEKGRPTRLKKALQAWGFGSKEAAASFAAKHKKG
jgi:hypothetical protein